MKIIFHIPYQTAWGETLHAVLYRAGATANERKINIPLTTRDDGKSWNGEIQLLLKHPLTLHYHYEVRQEGRVLRREWQTVPRLLHISPSADTYFLQDNWRDLPQEAFLYSSAMTDIFRKRERTEKPAPLFARTLILRAQTARPEPGEKLYICGSSDALGKWNPENALPLTEGQHNEWTISLDIDTLEEPIQYKFLIKKDDNTGEPLWETGGNHILRVPLLKENQIWIEDDIRPVFSWKNLFRAAGVVLPVFSLRTENGWGSGDFGDLEKLVDWAALTAQRVIQILPINDTTITQSWRDSYPYNAVSVYAFHPFYADMRQLPALDAEKEKDFEEKRKKLNDLPFIDYESVTKLKLKRLREAFKQEGKKVLSSEEFRSFERENAHWLPAYAMFCVLRDRFQTADFSRWPQYSYFSYDELRSFVSSGTPSAEEVRFWYYVQFTLHKQLLKASNYAREKGIILKGDIPIGISPYSVEAWMEKNFFNLNAQAGAPPDDFSATGQNWGFPTYNWDVMARDGYRWWSRRFTHMARYFDAYRIDHVLGFFRIWEIPSHSVQGLLGQFTPALPMDRDEIESYGLGFKESFLKPYISEKMLQEKFGDLAQEVKENYLLSAGMDLYMLRPEYATQRQVEEAIPGDDDKNTVLREGLYSLISNVLFVPDRSNPLKYHPRISALTDEAFSALSPTEKEAYTHLYNDYFFRRHNEFWKKEALKKLPALIQSTRLLCCAEDLGMIPACVPAVMEKLQMLSLEIERMPKQLGKTFADTKNYPYLSVATPSTHDMSVLRAWWKESPELTKQFWNQVLGKGNDCPEDADGQTCEEIVDLHLESPSMLALLSFQDWTSMDENIRFPYPEAERINVPANPRHYWRYRMHLTIENLLEQDVFNAKVREKVLNNHR